MLQRVDALRELAVLRMRLGAHAVHGQQAFLPFAAEEQPLLRAVAEVALVVFPAARHAPAQAEFLEQVLHFARIVAGRRQVVRAERTGNAADHAAARIAACRILELEQHEVLDAREPQCARGGEACDTATGDHHARALDGCRRRALERAIAQRMAARHVDAGEAAFDGRRRGLAAGERKGTRRTGHAEEIAPLHVRT